MTPGTLSRGPPSLPPPAFNASGELRKQIAALRAHLEHVESGPQSQRGQTAAAGAKRPTKATLQESFDSLSDASSEVLRRLDRTEEFSSAESLQKPMVDRGVNDAPSRAETRLAQYEDDFEAADD
jgi:hypothetical protein